MNRPRLALLLDLLHRPTAPFREHLVITWIMGMLTKARVPFFADPIGNIIVGVDSPAAYRRLIHRKTDEPLRVFIAHMDHPGFHGLRWRRERLVIKWHGGSPVTRLRGARVWLADENGIVAYGHLTDTRLTTSKRALDRGLVRLDESAFLTRSPATRLFGGFAFRAAAWRRGQRIYAQAADDLVGAFGVLNTALDLYANRSPQRSSFLGLLTRGEEVGFVGAVGHLELNWLAQRHRPVVSISLESSRPLSNAEIGKGPVVRLGDRLTVFEPGALQVLSLIARRVASRYHQRRVMDGGTCEATAATAYGFPAIGISVPLGNYHNQSFEGGPDARGPHGPAPEFVDVADVDGMLGLCRGLMQPKLPWSHPWTAQRQRLQKNFHKYRRML